MDRPPRLAADALRQKKKPYYPSTVAEIRELLGGKDLGCYCEPGQPCHGDILLRIANPVSAKKT